MTTYDKHLITQFTSSSTNCGGSCGGETSGLHINTYDTKRRVIRQERGNEVIDIAYRVPKAETDVTTRIYDESNGTLLQTRYEYYEFGTTNGEILRHTQQMGAERDTVSFETDDLVTRYTYATTSEGRPRLTQKVLPDGTSQGYAYDAAGNVLTEAVSKPSEETLTTTYTYEAGTQRIASVEVSSSADALITRMTRNYLNGLLLQESVYKDATTTLTTNYTYTLRGDVNTITDPEGNVQQFEYNGAGFPARVYDPRTR